MYVISIGYILGWFLFFNVIGFVLTMVDKNRARRSRRRIRERTLFWVAGLGGAAMMFLTMRLIHHKTRHKRFMIGLPLMIVGHALLCWFLVYGCPFIRVTF